MDVKVAGRDEVAIAAHDLRKNYAGAAEGAGLNGFDLRVAPGTVCGLLGPNGAGKDDGDSNPVHAPAPRLGPGERRRGSTSGHRRGQVRERIGLVGQYAAVDEILSGRQNLVMFGRLNHLSADRARRRADELLERFSLADAGGRPVVRYSGGMRRRLDLAASLIVAPPVLFVDEPTTGLDPAARQEVWAAVRDLVGSGTTVLLTTQYLEEADRLADRITMLGAGRVVTEGTPEELKSAIGGDWLDLVLADQADVTATEALAARVASGEVHVDAEARRVSVPVAERTRALVTMATALGDAGIEPLDVTLRRPTLDEVFLHLTSGEEGTRPPVAVPASRTGRPLEHRPLPYGGVRLNVAPSCAGVRLNAALSRTGARPSSAPVPREHDAPEPRCGGIPVSTTTSIPRWRRHPHEHDDPGSTPGPAARRNSDVPVRLGAGRLLDHHPARPEPLGPPARPGHPRVVLPDHDGADVRRSVRRRHRVPGGGGYFDFLIPGMFAMTVLFGLESTMTAVTTDAAKGVTDRFPVDADERLRGRDGPGDRRHAQLGRRAGRHDRDRAAAGLAWRRGGPPRRSPLVGLSSCFGCASPCLGGASSSDSSREGRRW
ncbi:ATP-binding cassette domain-containing protein [Streptosporangium vulgare]|uniref:ATP-binding cassette domain-containing protein n=1 Tax=Streptosporangium vulgare TaxID=46190 RepID=UPI003CD061D9